VGHRSTAAGADRTASAPFQPKLWTVTGGSPAGPDDFEDVRRPMGCRGFVDAGDGRSRPRGAARFLPKRESPTARQIGVFGERTRWRSAKRVRILARGCDARSSACAQTYSTSDDSTSPVSGVTAPIPSVGNAMERQPVPPDRTPTWRGSGNYFPLVSRTPGWGTAPQGVHATVHFGDPPGPRSRRPPAVFGDCNR